MTKLAVISCVVLLALPAGSDQSDLARNALHEYVRLSFSTPPGGSLESQTSANHDFLKLRSLTGTQYPLVAAAAFAVAAKELSSRPIDRVPIYRATLPPDVAACDAALLEFGYAKLPILFQNLLKDGKIHFVDVNTRRSDNGIWAMQSRGTPVVTGAFDCSKDRIFLDSDLRPFNFGATLLHEMSHFYSSRKAGISQAMGSDGRSVRHEILLDEIIAYSIGGLIQLSLLDLSMDMHKSHTPNRVPLNDLTWFNRARNGALNSIFRNNQSSVCGSIKHILNGLGRGVDAPADVRNLAGVVSRGTFGHDETWSLLKDTLMKVSWQKTPTLLSALTSNQSQGTLGFPTEENSNSLFACNVFQIAAQQGATVGYLGGDVETGGEGGKVGSPLVRACNGTNP